MKHIDNAEYREIHLKWNEYINNKMLYGEQRINELNDKLMKKSEEEERKQSELDEHNELIKSIQDLESEEKTLQECLLREKQRKEKDLSDVLSKLDLDLKERSLFSDHIINEMNTKKEEIEKTIKIIEKRLETLVQNEMDSDKAIKEIIIQQSKGVN